jgi:NADH-ubiquinone oxidoreductase chain 5
MYLSLIFLPLFGG